MVILRAINLPFRRFTISTIFEGWGEIVMLNLVINRKTLIILVLLIGVSCGDLRGGPAVLPDGATTGSDSETPENMDEPAPEVTDPSDIDDPADSEASETADANEGSGDSFESGDACGAETVTTEAVYAPVDIFWVVDTSSSMNDEIALIEERLGLFADFIAETGLDYRIIVIGAQHEERPQSYDICVPPPLSSVDTCPDADGERYRHVRRHVHSTEPLVVMLQAFEDYADFIRPNAVAHVINVTDDNSEISAESFLADLAATGHLPFINDPIVHAIASDVGEMCFLGICWDSACDGPYGQAAQIGREYLDITAMTGGVFRDICTGDWDPVFDAIAETVIASTQVPCAFQFPETPAGYGISLEFIEVEFQGMNGIEQVSPVANASACGPEGGWYVDDPSAPTTLYLCPESCGNVVGTLDIVFGCGKS